MGVIKIIDVPTEFQPIWSLKYPNHQEGPRFEQYAYDWLCKSQVNTKYVYLPIFWTHYMVNHQFGNHIGPLKKYVKEMFEQCKGKKVFTICEYADGIKVTWPGDNLTVFNCACHGGITLPLLCDPHPVKRSTNKKYVASFVGRLDTHPIRKKMAKIFHDWSDVAIIDNPASTETFREVMNESYYALCPRGYGPTSFRLYEAIQMGVKPIYITDRPLIPYGKRLPGLTTNDFDFIKGALRNPKIASQAVMITEEKQKMYTMEYACKYVEEKIRDT